MLKGKLRYRIDTNHMYIQIIYYLLISSAAFLPYIQAPLLAKLASAL
jgi:hypothetical protein